MVELVLFGILALTSVAGAVTVIFARNPVHAAMGLLGTLFSLGVMYVVNLAHLVAAVQVIVYAGAVMTLFLFVIMLIGVDKAEDRSESLPLQRPVALILLALVAAGVLAAGARAWTTGFPAAAAPVNGTAEAIGERLFDAWVLPFEVTALLLIIAAAGTIALAFFRGDDGEEGR